MVYDFYYKHTEIISTDEIPTFFWSWNNVLEPEEYTQFLSTFLKLHSSVQNCQELSRMRCDNFVFNTIASLENPDHLQKSFALILSTLENYRIIIFFYLIFIIAHIFQYIKYEVVLKKAFLSIFDHLHSWSKVVVSNSLKVWLYVLKNDSNSILYFDEDILHILYISYEKHQNIEVIQMLIVLLKSQYSESYIDLINTHCFIELFFDCLSLVDYDNEIVLLLIECIKLLDGLNIRDLVNLYSNHLNVIKSSSNVKIVDLFNSVFSQYM